MNPQEYVYVAAWIYEWGLESSVYYKDNRIWSGCERRADAVGETEKAVFDTHFNMERWDEGTTIKATKRVLYNFDGEDALFITIANPYSPDQYYIIRRAKFISDNPSSKE